MPLHGLGVKHHYSKLVFPNVPWTLNASTHITHSRVATVKTFYVLRRVSRIWTKTRRHIRNTKSIFCGELTTLFFVLTWNLANSAESCELEVINDIQGFRDRKDDTPVLLLWLAGVVVYVLFYSTVRHSEEPYVRFRNAVSKCGIKMPMFNADMRNRVLLCALCVPTSNTCKNMPGCLWRILHTWKSFLDTVSPHLRLDT